MQIQAPPAGFIPIEEFQPQQNPAQAPVPNVPQGAPQMPVQGQAPSQAPMQAPAAPPAPTPSQGDERLRSVWDKPQEMRDNRVISDGSEGYTIENDPQRLKVGKQLTTMLADGTSDEEVLQFLATSGITNVENIEEILAYRRTPEFAEWQRQNPGAPYPLHDTFDDVHVPLTAAGEALAWAASTPVGAALAGASEGATLSLNDELAGVVGGTVDTIRDGGDWTDNYDRNVQNFRHGQETIQANNPGSYLIGEVGGALATGGAVARGIGTSGQMGARALATEGAVLGGVQGAADAEGGIADRAIGGAIGLTTGGVLGGAGGAVAGRFARVGDRAAASSDNIRAIDDMNQRYGLEGGERVQPLPGQVGGAGTRIAQGVSDSTLLGAAALSRANDKFAQNSGRLLDRMAGATDDTVRSTEEAASRISRTGDDGNLAALPSRLTERVDRLYDNARSMAGNATLSTPRTVALLDREIARLERRPGKVANLDDLREFRDNLANNRYTVDTLRDERTAVGRLLDSNDSAQRGINKRIWGTLSEDISDGLSSAGLDNAARAFRRADVAHAKATEHTELVGGILKGSDEEIGRRLVTLSRSDGRRLHNALRLMAPEDSQTVRQSVIQGLGRKGDEQFSPSTFMTNWNKLSEHGKTALFPGQHRSDIDAFADLMGRANDSWQFANSSQTARSAMAITMLRQLVGNAGAAGVGAAVSGGGTLVGTAVGAAGSGVLAVLLSSPKMARLLVRIGKSGGTRAQLTSTLTKFATRNPDLEDQVSMLQDALNSVPEADRMAAMSAPATSQETTEDAPMDFAPQAPPEGFIPYDAPPAGFEPLN